MLSEANVVVRIQGDCGREKFVYVNEMIVPQATENNKPRQLLQYRAGYHERARS